MDSREILLSILSEGVPDLFKNKKNIPLREPEFQLFRLILDKIPAFIHIIDVRKDTIVWKNAEWDRLFAQFKAGNRIDLATAFQSIIHPDDHELLKASGNYFKNKSGTFFGGIIRIKYPGEDSWNWLVGLSRVISKDAEDRPLYTLAVFLDFTKATHTECQITEALHEILRRSNKATLEKLTPREKEIIRLLVKGYSNNRIAQELYISHHTVESHRKNIRIKLNVKNTSELISLAKDLGI